MYVGTFVIRFKICCLHFVRDGLNYYQQQQQQQQQQFVWLQVRMSVCMCICLSVTQSLYLFSSLTGENLFNFFLLLLLLLSKFNIHNLVMNEFHIRTRDHYLLLFSFIFSYSNATFREWVDIVLVVVVIVANFIIIFFYFLCFIFSKWNF